MNFFSFRMKMPFMLLVSAVVHLVILFSFVLTFPLPKAFARPYFVFLGSLLSDQDLFSTVNMDEHQKISEKQKFNLDVRRDSSARQMIKPRLTSAVLVQDKIQFKPTTNKESGVVKYKNDLEGLGGEFTPVRMKLDRNDQD